MHNALAVIRTATQLAQRRRLSPEPQVPRALIWRGRDGSPQVPRALTRGAAPSRPECRITGSTPQRQGTLPGGSRSHFRRPTSSSRTRWFSTRARQAAQTQLDDDSILILRQMYITSLARASRAAVSLPGPRSFLEHPEDPVVSSSLPKAKECSSFWITEEGQLWMEENSLTAISFDQCRLSQLVKKATTLATDLPIQDWDQMRCTHQSHVGTNESSTLSRYPWDMMAGLAKAIAVSLAALGHIRIPSQFPETLRNHLRGGGRTLRRALPLEENGNPIREAVPPHHTRAQSPEARMPRSPACTGRSTLRQTP